jgi:hypothetical protein
MATRSTIGVRLPDGTIESIYCHWDGYPSHNGKRLKEHYRDIEKVLDLMEQGNISYLESSPAACARLGADYNRPKEPSILHDTIEAWKSLRCGWGCEYAYLYNPSTDRWTTYNL